MTDRIEKAAVLNAPLDRVWQAISDSAQFGTWFGMLIDEPFVVGATVRCVMTGTAMDEEVAAEQRNYEGQVFPLHIVAVQPRTRFVFRWNPLPDSQFAEITTLVEFTLTEVADGVLLEIVESGFDALPEDRRAQAFQDNSGGWATQLDLVGRYVAQPR